MTEKYPKGIGPFGRWIIFWGMAMFVLILAAAKHDVITRIFGPKFDSYAPLGIAVFLWIISRILYDKIPSKLAFWIGTIGWILTFTFAYYWYCVGPGSFGYHAAKP